MSLNAFYLQKYFKKVMSILIMCLFFSNHLCKTLIINGNYKL